MNDDGRITLRWPVIVGAVMALLVVGAGAMYFLMSRSAAVGERRQEGSRPGSFASAETMPSRAPAETVVTLPPEAIERAGIELVSVTRSVAGSSAVRIPGTVEPNAYKQVIVTPLVSGRVTRVTAELGDQVRQGQTLLQVFSPQLADAQTAYLAAKAELEAHEQELARTTKLAAIGAASQQEIERLHAEHSAKLSGVQSLRSRLVLLGLTASAIDTLSPAKEVESAIDIPAPISGVITERAANVGLNVDPATKLLTVVDLSSVWVVGGLYERDFARVSVGSAASVTTTADPAVRQGRVSYVDPQVSAETRTARVRVEVLNPGQTLKLGMFADIEVGVSANREAVRVPRVAVQNVGGRQVVYVANRDEHGKFIERQVQLGDVSGEQVEVISGLKEGEQIVSKGSFFIRAERERVGGTNGSSAPPPGS